MNRRGLVAALVVYALFLAAIVGAMFYVRAEVLRGMDTPEAREDWEAWREEVKSENVRPGAPVLRKIPRSEEPPALRMMRDHFAISTIMLAVLGSVVYWMAAVGVHAMFQPTTTMNAAQTPPTNLSRRTKAN